MPICGTGRSGSSPCTHKSAVLYYTDTAPSWILLSMCLLFDYTKVHYGVDSLQQCQYGFLAHCSVVVAEFRLADVLSLELLLCAEGMLKY